MVLNREMMQGHVGAEVLRELAERSGMAGLLAAGVAKILNGTTSVAEVISVAA